ncbi:phage tail protein [Siccationidurans soli]|uniref:Phage tail protein n=2 Tax=Hymenobacter negativus TaxID=2795026 RepID=A0ABS3QEV9_9BACT|nr:phage tail protein [Hymenobacter negativus]
MQALFGRRLLAKAAAPARIASPAGVSSSAGSPFVGEIIMAAFNFAPHGYVRCDGQLLPLSQNTALFALLGTTYGGNGQSNFALPNLNGRVPLGAGQGPGLSYYDLGQTGGSDAVTLLPTEMPAHSHTMALSYSQSLGNTASPENAYLASNGAGRPQYAATSTAYMASGATGSAQPHNNMQPYQVLAYYIAVQGIFPPRS